MLQGRVPLAAAEDGMFPAPFAKVHGKRRTPVFGLVVSSVLVSVLMLMNYTKGLVDAFTFVILLATLTTLVPYAFSAAAQAWLWLVEGEKFDIKHLVRDVVVAAWPSPTACGRSPARATTSSRRASCSCSRHPGLHRHALVADPAGRPRHHQGDGAAAGRGGRRR